MKLNFNVKKKSRFIKLFFIVNFFLMPLTFSNMAIKINSVQIRGPFPNNCKTKGCLYTTICCDCKNAKRFTTDYSVTFDMDEINLVANYPLPLRSTTGSTELEKKMFHDIGIICNDKKVCKFELHPEKYGAKYYVSKAYEVQIEYSCQSMDINFDSYVDKFTDTFENPEYRAYISCDENIKTTKNKATFFDMTTNFKRIAFSGITLAILGKIIDHYFNEEFFDSFIKW
ncbi:MAG: hypothetical protein HRT87_08735 [Legionellales bacterium]|nr:hypothetical protein [Legionellales bacterium]